MTHRKALIDRVATAYREAYGEPPEQIVGAPGRVNLIGEHCDYNEGLVLPCAIDRETMIAIGAGSDGAIRVRSADFSKDGDAFVANAPVVPADTDWKNHVRGVAHFMQRRGIDLPSVNLAIAGNLPIGVGLSSSASLGVAVALALALRSGADLKCADFAHLAQQAENDFVGCACGIMDQMASACGEAGTALLVDCRSLERRAIPIADGLAIVIIDSGIRRTLTDSPFNARRSECEAAAAHYGIPALRDLDTETLVRQRSDLDDALFRRARHVVTEIDRVHEAIDALATTDLTTLSELMRASHRSLRDDFEVSIPPIDALVSSIAAIVGDRGGVRMTGAGFGGCLVAIVAAEAADEICGRIIEESSGMADISTSAAIYEPSAGARLIDW